MDLACVPDALLQDGFTGFIASTLQDTRCDADVGVRWLAEPQVATALLLIPTLPSLQPIVDLIETDAFWTAAVLQPRK